MCVLPDGNLQQPKHNLSHLLPSAVVRAEDKKLFFFFNGSRRKLLTDPYAHLAPRMLMLPQVTSDMPRGYLMGPQQPAALTIQTIILGLPAVSDTRGAKV